MKTLTIKLTGPLQSYGNEATFSRRTSYHYPSKSAVIGLIAAALGYRRGDLRIKRLNELKMAVRIDQPGRTLTDFQTIEYNQKNGKRSLSYRDYLQDAVFVVAVAGEDQQIKLIETALHHPKFQLFLGRRANVPAGLLVTQVFDEENPAVVLRQYEWQAAKWYQRQQRQPKYVAEIIADADLAKAKLTTFVKDNVGSFSQDHRWHSYRTIISMDVELENRQYHGQDTSHDIMANLEG